MPVRAMLRRALVATAATVFVAAAATAALAAPPSRGNAPGATGSTTRARALFSDGFGTANGPNGLITNEFTYWNAAYPGVVTSSLWELTSGSFFSSGGLGWSGKADACAPDIYSRTCTNSAIFRLTTRRSTLGDVVVGTDLRINSLASTTSTPAVAWDGIHIFLRSQTEYSLYYASVARRDGTVVIKKKCPGGPSNGGTYYDLSPYVGGHPIAFGTWTHVRASVVTNAD